VFDYESFDHEVLDHDAPPLTPPQKTPMHINTLMANQQIDGGGRTY
jgi:hypothetical protein